MRIPEYKTVAGIILPPVKMKNKEIWQCIRYTNEYECKTYIETLEAEGFICRSMSELPCGTEMSHLKNLFYALTRENLCIYMSWMAVPRILQIHVALSSELPEEKRYEQMPQVVQPSVTQLRQEVSGICHVVQTGDGSFILMDGGLYTDADANRLYNFLTERTSCGKPIISMWMFSHPDIDHVQLATTFLCKYKTLVSVESFAWRFPDTDSEQLLCQNMKVIKENEENLFAAIQESFPEAKVYTLHAGQKMFFPGVTVEILWTMDMMQPCQYLTGNDFSGAWRFCFESGKTYLFMGDCQVDACMRMGSMYGDYLKSDIFQLPHHGLIGGELGFYKHVDPDVCFWATSEERFRGLLEGQRFQWCIGEGGCDYNVWIRDAGIRQRKHYHQGETVTIMV